MSCSSARGIEFADLDVFYLAGGFGRRIDVEAAQRIGLIPRSARAGIVQLGNAAIEGASMALLSHDAPAGTRSPRRRRSSMCRLETHPHFFDLFVEGCQFKPVESVQGTPW